MASKKPKTETCLACSGVRGDPPAAEGLLGEQASASDDREEEYNLHAQKILNAAENKTYSYVTLRSIFEMDLASKECMRHVEIRNAMIQTPALLYQGRTCFMRITCLSTSAHGSCETVSDPGTKNSRGVPGGEIQRSSDSPHGSVGATIGDAG